MLKSNLFKLGNISVIVLLSLGYILWFLDLVRFFGIKFFEDFFIAAGLYYYEQFLYIFIISFLSLPLVFNFLFSDKIRINLELIGYFVFLLLAFISSFFFSIEPFDSIREFIIMGFVFLFMLFSYNSVYNLEDKDSFFYNFSLFLVILLVLLIFIAIFVNMGMPPNSYWMSFFYQKNAFAGYLLILLPIPFSLFVLSLIYRDYFKAILFLSAFLFALIALVFSGSKAAILSFFISLPLYFGLFKIFTKIYLNLKDFKIEKKTLIIAFSTLIFIIFILFLQLLLDKKLISTIVRSFQEVLRMLSNTVLARIDFYLASFSIAKDFPFGCGLYNFSKTYPLYQSAFYFYSKDPHNYYFKVLSELGVLGFLLLISIFSSFIFRCVSIYNNFISKLNFNNLVFIIDKLLITSENSEEDIKQRLNDLENEIGILRRLNIVILSAGLSIGLIQSMIHIAFDVDFKFSFILITFFILLAFNLGFIDYIKLENNADNSNWFSKQWVFDSKFFKGIFVFLFVIFLCFSFIFSYRELRAYYLDKLADKASDLDSSISYYHKILNSSFKSSSKYITLAEFYRAKGDYLSAELYNKEGIKRSKYNINGYISLAYCYLQDFEIKYNLYSSVNKSNLDSSLKIKLGNMKQQLLSLLKNVRIVLKEALKYDKYNYPDIYLLLAKSYYYEQLLENKELYSLRLFRNIFKDLYPSNELPFLMDVRKPNFYQVILEAYDYYTKQDFEKCLLVPEDDKYISNCIKVFGDLYNPLVLQDLSAYDENTNLYAKAGIVSYILGKYYLKKKDVRNQFYFRECVNLFSRAKSVDIVSVYYTVMSLFYLNDLVSAYNIAFYISKANNKNDEDFNIIKSEMYSVLANIYKTKEFIYYNPKYSDYYFKLYKKYSK